MVYVYGIFHGKEVYVGETINIKRRYSQHKRNNRWVNALIEKGLKPDLRILDNCKKRDGLQKEKEWKLKLRKKGYNIIEKVCNSQSARKMPYKFFPPLIFTNQYDDLQTKISKYKNIILQLIDEAKYYSDNIAVRKFKKLLKIIE